MLILLVKLNILLRWLRPPMNLAVPMCRRERLQGVQITAVTHGEVNAGDSVENEEDVGVGELGEAEVESGREEEDQDLQVEVERRPRRRLVLGDRRDDRDVVLGVARVQQRVEAAGPRGHLACGRERERELMTGT